MKTIHTILRPILIGPKSYIKVKIKYSILSKGSLFALCLMAFNSHAALSANTSKTIQGSAPYFKHQNVGVISDLSELAHLYIEEGSNKQDHAPIANDIKYITLNKNVTPRAFSALMPIDNEEHDIKDINNLLLVDPDGDAQHNASTGTVKATLSKGGYTITDYDTPLADGTYRIIINFSDSVAATKYGDPHSTPYSEFMAIYLITINSGGGSTPTPNPTNENLYIKPANMELSSKCGASSSTSSYCKFSTGYNSKVFDTTNGFIVSKLSDRQFPQTAFPGASFTLVHTSSNITCTASPATELTQSGCTFTYKTAKPTKAVIITISSGGTQTGSYTVKVPNLWTDHWGFGRYNSYNEDQGGSGSDGTAMFKEDYPIGKACSGTVFKGIAQFPNVANLFFTRAEITNNNNIDLADYTYQGGKALEYHAGEKKALNNRFGGFSRDADGSFMGEWGNLAGDSYGDSVWKKAFSVKYYDYIWTKEAVSPTGIFTVGKDGDIDAKGTAASSPTVCK